MQMKSGISGANIFRGIINDVEVQVSEAHNQSNLIKVKNVMSHYFSKIS